MQAGKLKFVPPLFDMSLAFENFKRIASVRSHLWWIGIVAAPIAFLAALNGWFAHLTQVDSAWRVSEVRALVSDANSIDELPEAGWKTVPVSGGFVNRTMQSISAWYRIDVSVATPDVAVWAIYLLRPSGNYTVFVNGHAVGESAPMFHPIPQYVTPLMFRFPGALLHPGRNVVDVHGASEYMQIGLGDVQIGPDRILTPRYRALLFSDQTIKQITAGVLLALGVLMLVLAVSAARESVFGWYAVALIFMAAQIWMRQVPALPFGAAPLWSDVVNITMTGYILCATCFINRVVGVQRSRFEKKLLYWTLAGGIAMLLDTLLLDGKLQWVCYFLWIPPMLPICTYQAWLLIRAAQEKPSFETRMLAIVTAVGLVVATRDGLIDIGIVSGRPYLAYAMGPVLLTFGYILVRRFVGALNVAELSRRELEVRIAEKTAELERSVVRMKDLEREQALSNERERIMRDMHDGVGGQLVQTLSIVISRPELQAVEEPLRCCLDELRLIIDSIEPSDGDLSSVLGMLRVRMSRRLTDAGIQLRWQVDDLPPLDDFGPRKVSHILRIVHEAIANALKHSRSNQISIRACVEESFRSKAIVIAIADDGIGFDSTSPEGRGLINMRCRAVELCAQLSVNSGQRGTTVQLKLPLSNAAPNRRSALTQAPKKGSVIAS